MDASFIEFLHLALRHSETNLFGGKLVAAMDRQHPRDLFDVMQLFAREGTTAAVRRAVQLSACWLRGSEC